MGSAREIRNKHASCYGKIPLAVINNFLSSLYTYTFGENNFIFRFSWVAIYFCKHILMYYSRYTTIDK